MIVTVVAVIVFLQILFIMKVMCSVEIMNELEPYLHKIKPTAPGLDASPSWLFAKCSYELAGIIAHIFNSSFCAGVVPEQWKRSVVNPVAKVPKPSCLILITVPFQSPPSFPVSPRN